MLINDLEVEEYLPVNIPDDCSYSKMVNLAVLVKSRQFDYWVKLDLHWIFSTMKWWRWC